jgi:hypothetical protein
MNRSVETTIRSFRIRGESFFLPEVLWVGNVLTRRH